MKRQKMISLLEKLLERAPTPEGYDEPVVGELTELSFDAVSREIEAGRTVVMSRAFATAIVKELRAVGTDS